MKPWARIEVDYINHQKFLVLNANAIVLWHEGKNYCNRQSTDGLIPLEQAKRFRFHSKKAVAMLLKSAGTKPGTEEAYAPLWERHDIGFKMHDYLEHNDCRDVVLARIAQADQGRQQDKEYKRQARAAKKAKRTDVRSDVRSDTVPESGSVRSMSGSIQNTEDRKQEKKKRRAPPPLNARSNRPIFDGQRFAVFEWQLDELCKMLGSHTNEFDLHAWFFTADTKAVTSGIVRKRDEWWPWLEQETYAEAIRRGLPMEVAAVGGYDAVWAEVARKGPSVRP